MVQVRITKDIETGPSQAGAPFHSAVHATAGQTIEVDERTANWLVQNRYASQMEGGADSGEVKPTTEAEDAAQREAGETEGQQTQDGSEKHSDPSKATQDGSGAAAQGGSTSGSTGTTSGSTSGTSTRRK